MTPQRTHIFGLLLVMTLTASVAFSLRCAKAEPMPPLIVLMAVSAGISDIDLGTLRRTFQGYPTDLGGKRLIPFNHAVGTADRTRFDRALLGLTPEQVGRFWVDQKIRQASLAPRSFPDANLAIRVVSSLPGAISYVSMSTQALPVGLRALSVGGYAPGTPDYPLAYP